MSKAVTQKDIIQEQVDRNYKYFQEHKEEISEENQDKYVLIRDQNFIAFYSTREDALTAGKSQFEDNRFSVQKVSDESVELGAVGYALF